MIALLIAVGVAFAVTVLGTPLLIRVLRKRGIGQLIRDDGPFTHPHAGKAGTPTMGGIAIVGGVTLGYLVAHVRTEQIKFAAPGCRSCSSSSGSRSSASSTTTSLSAAVATSGCASEARPAVSSSSRAASRCSPSVGQRVDAPLVHPVDRPRPRHLVWFAFAVVVIYGTSNAVNLTDGLDGLAAGSATLVFGAFMVICFWQFRHPVVYGIGAASAIDIAVIAAALTGACGGFLWWNAAPARIFMGDTGSLAIGGAMAGLALLSNIVLLLPILGGLYVIETVSVIAQVISFRGFGRRVLRMAPIHHHFEVSGWPEFTVIVRFWLFAGVCVALGLGLFYADFISIPGAID